LILIVSTGTLYGFLALYTECSPGKSVQAPLPDSPLAAEANAKGVILDALQGGLNLPAGRGHPPKVHQSKFSLGGEDTLLEFVRARLNSDSVSATQLLAEFNPFVCKNSCELLGLSGCHVCSTLLALYFDT
jgi:hypothetical protein